jgi:hypothetical protein
MTERRAAYLRARLRSRGTFWVMVGAIAASLVTGDLRVIAAGPALAFLLILLVAYRSAHAQAETEFFGELAPSLGLSYTVGGAYVPITPLLAAGDRRRFEHTMEGPLFGKLGGPPCLIGHYTFETRHEHDDVTVWRPHPFTVCAIDIGAPLLELRGIYMRPRLSGLGLDHDWLDRAPRPEKVELESARFNELYDLRRSQEQDDVPLRELFSPSFIVSLAENPLQPGFECKGGTLVVFIRGHEDSAGRIAMLHDTARSISRRVAHFSAAGQMIR